VTCNDLLQIIFFVGGALAKDGQAKTACLAHKEIVTRNSFHSAEF